MRYLGQWQERCEEVIEELSSVAGVLCVEGLIDLVRLGGGDPTASVAAFLLPYLQSGQLRVVAEATPSELDACRRLLPGFPQAFETVRVEELRDAAAAAALEEVASSGSRHMGLELDEGAANAALRLFRRFMPYHPLPGRAGEFLRRLFDREKQSGQSRVDTDQVVERFLCETGLPELFLDDELPLPFDDVLAALREDVIGQDDACRTVARLVCTLKTGLNDPRRPVGALLFCGPTGVGKTQLAKTLSQYLFGHGDHADRLVRLDMSEYSAGAAAERLVTKADGTPSDFIGRVRRQPFVVVLFDEIEKAAPEVFDMLLGLLDEGRLTDRYGRTTWFRTAIVVMTSNLGTSRNESIGFVDSSRETYQREVRAFFRPEFFNRLDGIVTFSPLDRRTCAAVTRKELTDLTRREGFVKRRLQLRFSDSLVDHLVAEGFHPSYGARPLQRAVERHVVSRVSRYLVKNPQLRAGTLEIDFDLTRNDVVIRVAAAGH
jgi:ATP-dependent Clp protease ATP-binding subunit ClpC